MRSYFHTRHTYKGLSQALAWYDSNKSPALLYLKNIYFGDWSLLAPHELFSLSQKPQELGEICLTKACKKKPLIIGLENSNFRCWPHFDLLISWAQYELFIYSYYIKKKLLKQLKRSPKWTYINPKDHCVEISQLFLSLKKCPPICWHAAPFKF